MWRLLVPELVERGCCAVVFVVAACVASVNMGLSHCLYAQDATSTTESNSRRQWQQSEHAIGLVDQGQVVWQYHFGEDLTVPYFDPVATAGGPSQTWNSPTDHPWHHALWFSWKYINGVNYWEHADDGRPAGRTTWSHVNVTARKDHSAVITMQCMYSPASGRTGRGSDESAAKDIVLREDRTLRIDAPDSSGSYRIDWDSTFVAQADRVVLDRTPPKEQSWGGYAGLSVRFAEQLTERELTSESAMAKFGTGDRHRSRAVAMDYSGTIDGVTSGIAIIDQSTNPRHPTPWYAIRSPVMSYINAALLADSRLELAHGESIRLRYRIVVHAGRWDASRLREEIRRYGQADEGGGK
ncbi:MAG: PmoA family protein [Pirellulaceae bacterium]|nr:PmoA family protein [Planctomycetales bacterium]